MKINRKQKISTINSQIIRIEREQVELKYSEAP